MGDWRCVCAERSCSGKALQLPVGLGPVPSTSFAITASLAPMSCIYNDLAPGCLHFSCALQASFMETDYSMLPVDTPHDNGDSVVPADDLVKLLEQSLDRVDAAYA